MTEPVPGRQAPDSLHLKVRSVALWIKTLSDDHVAPGAQNAAFETLLLAADAIAPALPLPQSELREALARKMYDTKKVGISWGGMPAWVHEEFLRFADEAIALLASQPPAPEAPSSQQPDYWPSAKLTVHECKWGGLPRVTAALYAPGLPSGEYDLYLPPSAAPEAQREPTETSDKAFRRWADAEEKYHGVRHRPDYREGAGWDACAQLGSGRFPKVKWEKRPDPADGTMRLYAVTPTSSKHPLSSEAPVPQSEPLSEVPFLIYFDDADCKPRIVIGEKAARHVFKEVSSSWNAHLFVKIESNSRDDPYAAKNAAISIAQTATPQGERQARQLADTVKRLMGELGKAVEVIATHVRFGEGSALQSRVKFWLELANDSAAPPSSSERKASESKASESDDRIWLERPHFSWVQTTADNPKAVAFVREKCNG